MITARVVVPYTTLYPETVAALEAAHIDAEYVRMQTPFSYAELLRSIWARQQTTVIVEHDIVPRVGDVQKLLRCPQPWCGFVYNIGNGYVACLGFSKFRGDFMARYPDLMDRAAADERDGIAAGLWVRMDTRIDNQLNPLGHHIHEHWPPCPHLNPKQVIPCELSRGWCHWPPRRDPN